MTIRSSINARELNDALTRLEARVEGASRHEFLQARAATEVVSDTSNFLIRAARDLGFEVHNDDRLREVEAVIYGWLKAANPEAYELTVAEGARL